MQERLPGSRSRSLTSGAAGSWARRLVVTGGGAAPRLSLLVTATSLICGQELCVGGLFSLLVLGLPLGALFYLMVVPQRKQRAKQAEFLAKLGVGDDVITSGGIYGTITDLEDGVAHLEINSDVVIRVLPSLISLPRPASSSLDTA